MAYAYALAEHGKTLATRPLGETLRKELIESAHDSEIVELDFTDVLGTSHSFADEFVAALAEEVQNDEVGFALTLVGASGEVERVIRRALERREVSIRQLA